MCRKCVVHNVTAPGCAFVVTRNWSENVVRAQLCHERTVCGVARRQPSSSPLYTYIYIYFFFFLYIYNTTHHGCGVFILLLAENFFSSSSHIYIWLGFSRGAAGREHVRTAIRDDDEERAVSMRAASRTRRAIASPRRMHSPICFGVRVVFSGWYHGRNRHSRGG